MNAIFYSIHTKLCLIHNWCSNMCTIIIIEWTFLFFGFPNLNPNSCVWGISHFRGKVRVRAHPSLWCWKCWILFFSVPLGLSPLGPHAWDLASKGRGAKKQVWWRNHPSASAGDGWGRGGDQYLMALAEVCLAGSKGHFGSCPGCGHTVFLPVFCVWFSSLPHDSVSDLIHSFLLNRLELVSGASN